MAMRGTVQWLNPATGYAFIVAEDVGEFFGGCVLECGGVNTLYEDDEITFEVEAGSAVSRRIKVTSVSRSRRAS